MPGTSVGLALNGGYAGNISRSGFGTEIEARPVYSGSAAIPFGSAVIERSDNTYALADATLTAANFAGVAVAVEKQNTNYTATTSGTSPTYQPLQPCDVVKRGIVDVVLGLRNTVPTSGGAVYLRTVLNGTYSTSLIGDFEAASDGSNSILLTNCTWDTGIVDANNIVELKIKGHNL